MKRMLGIFSFLFALMLPFLAFAADFRVESINKNDNLRNLYVAGQNVNVDANVGGDLTAAGNTVNVNGNVEKSAQVAGSTVNVKGSVGDNLRIAGGNINMNGKIGEDFVVFGGDVIIGSDGSINHDLVIMGGTVTINGTINGKVVGNAGNLAINGTVNGDVDLKNVGKISLGGGAVIGGKLNYASTQRSNINESQVKGGVNFRQMNEAEESRKGAKSFLAFSLLALLGSFLLLYLLTRVAPVSLEKFIGLSFMNPWANIGIGFVTLIIVPVALLFLLISVIGLPIAGLGLLVYILLLALSGILMELLAGAWLMMVFKKQDVYEISWLAIGIGVVFIAILKLIPVIGWIILLLLFLLALGGLTRMLYLAGLEQRK